LKPLLITLVPFAGLKDLLGLRVMALLTLLLTRDTDVLRMLERVLQELGVGVLSTEELDEAAELLERRKFDGVIVDCEGLPGSRALVHGLRRANSNRTAVVFALSSKSVSVRELFELGANFALEKPLVGGRVLRCFRAARPLLVRERRRYFRCGLETVVEVEVGSSPSRSFTSVNLSEGGMALSVPQGLPVGTAVKVSFSLPDVTPAIIAKGEVLWNSLDGQTGLKLAEMSAASRLSLCTWLARGMDVEEALPVGSVESQESPLRMSAS
jgi:CheY-like chemotaxis protein